MKISVSKFRQWAQEEWELPDTGMLRLSGISESGKSSLMYAIAWALYGGSATKNVTTIGQKGASVSLSGYGLEINRSKNPENLGCNGFVDDAAQAEIDRAMGMSWEQFSASSFIQQKLAGCLLTLAPAEQLRFVQKLAFGADDPDVYRNKIHATMKTLEAQVQVMNGIVGTLENQKKDTELTIESLPEVPEWLNEATIEAVEREIQETNKSINENQSTIQSLTSNIQSLTKELTNPDRKLHNNITTVEAQLKDKYQELSTYESEPVMSVLSEAELSQIMQRVHLCDKQAAFLTTQQRLQSEATNILKESGSEVTNPVECLKSLKDSWSFTLSTYIDNRDAAKSLLVKLQESLDVVHCPACQAALRKATDGKLVIAKDNAVTDEEIKKHISELRTLDKTIKEITTKITTAERLLQEYATMGTAPLARATSMEMVTTAKEKLNAQLLTNQSNISHNANRSSNINRTKKSIQATETELAAMKDKLSKLQLRSESDIQSELNVLQEKVSYRNGTMQPELMDFLSSLESKLEECSKYRQQDTERKLLLKQVTQLESQLAERKLERDNMQTKYSDVVRLKQLSDVAATDSVASILDAINTNAKIYLDMMFPDQGTSIRILNEKENKDGKKKAQFSLSIIHKGIEYGSLDEFSGGAQSRAILAFQLALSDLYNSPILLLDEPFAGTHGDLRDDCLEALKSVGERKLVLIAEHGCEDSSFDDVVPVK